MKQKTLGKIARDAFFDAKGNDGQDWAASAAAVVAEHERRKWRPIKTAPNDGTRVDLWTNNGRFTDCWFEKGEWMHWWIGGFDTMGAVRLDEVATHWQPAPEGPKL